MDNALNLNFEGLPQKAKETIVDFYEFIKQKYKYKEADQKPSRSRKRTIELMEKGLYKIPADFTFNRDELYD